MCIHFHRPSRRPSVRQLLVLFNLAPAAAADEKMCERVDGGYGFDTTTQSGAAIVLDEAMIRKAHPLAVRGLPSSYLVFPPNRRWLGGYFDVGRITRQPFVPSYSNTRILHPPVGSLMSPL